MPPFTRSLAGLALGLAAAAQASNSSTLPLPSKVVTQLALGTRIENLAVRSNGDLLLSLLDPYAAVYYVADPASDSQETFLLHNFTSVGGLLGITEVRPDVFMVVGGNFSGPSVQINGTGSAWTLDFAAADATSRTVPTPEVRLLAQMTEADFLNGATKLPAEGCTASAALVADSAKGLVWRIDTTTGDYAVAAQVPEMGYPADAILEIGVNGIQVHDGYLYWTNTFAATIYRVPIDADGYQIAGSAAETVLHVDGASILDDFVFDATGRIWAATNLDNTLLAIDPAAGTAIIAAGAVDQLTLAGDTAVQWARGMQPDAATTLYVSTSGGLSKPVNGTATEGGKVVAVDTRGFHF